MRVYACIDFWIVCQAHEDGPLYEGCTFEDAWALCTERLRLFWSENNENMKYIHSLNIAKNQASYAFVNGYAVYLVYMLSRYCLDLIWIIFIYNVGCPYIVLASSNRLGNMKIVWVYECIYFWITCQASKDGHLIPHDCDCEFEGAFACAACCKMYPIWWRRNEEYRGGGRTAVTMHQDSYGFVNGYVLDIV